jgi:hypothetical protein
MNVSMDINKQGVPSAHPVSISIVLLFLAEPTRRGDIRPLDYGTQPGSSSLPSLSVIRMTPLPSAFMM